MQPIPAGQDQQDSRQRLLQALTRLLACPVRIRWNRNRSTLASVRRSREGAVTFSLHEMFEEADEAVVRAIALMARRETTESRRAIRLFIAHHRHLLVQPAVEAPPPAVGRYHDLEALAREVNDHYFGGQLRFHLRWGQPPRMARCRRHITLGNWAEQTRTITINPLLDSADVPPLYVRFILYHEMLHIALPSRPNASGRMIHHPAEFLRRERQFEGFITVMEWQGQHLAKLLAPVKQIQRRRDAGGQMCLF